MDASIVVILVAIVLILVLLTVSVRRPRYHYKSRKTLLTPAELHFYKQLQQFLPSGYDIMCKVRLADIVFANETGSRRASAFNKIRSKHIDFVVIDTNTSEIKLAIELNDKSHLLPMGLRRDEFLLGVFKDTNIPFRQVRVEKNYKAEALEDIFRLANVTPRGIEPRLPG